MLSISELQPKKISTYLIFLLLMNLTPLFPFISPYSLSSPPISISLCPSICLSVQYHHHHHLNLIRTLYIKYASFHEVKKRVYDGKKVKLRIKYSMMNSTEETFYYRFSRIRFRITRKS